MVDVVGEPVRLAAIDGLQDQRPLTGGGQHDVEGQQFVRLAQPAQPFQPSHGQNQRVDRALGQPAEPGVDVAANLDSPQIGPDSGDLRRSARAAGTDPGPWSELGQCRRCAGDQGVASVHPGEKGRQHQPRRRQRRKVLRGMDRQLRPTIE